VIIAVRVSGGRRVAAPLKQAASNPYLQEPGILRVRIDTNIGLLALLVRSTTARQNLKPFDFAHRQGGPRSPAVSISDRLMRMQTRRGTEAIRSHAMPLELPCHPHRHVDHRELAPCP
jgi:hypothetical protein